MPTYSYICSKNTGGCGNFWKLFAPMEKRLDVACPKCGKGHMVQVLDQAPMFVRDIDSQDGRVNEKVHMPGLGKDVYVGSRSELKELLIRTRGENSEKAGVDTGEIHHVETNVGYNDPVDQSTGRTYSSQIRELEDKLGE